MSTATTAVNGRREAAVASANGRETHGGKRSHVAGGVSLGREQSREARQTAALILEVLAGTRTPTQAATALNVSVPRYYQLETRALHSLVAGCEPRPKGPGRNVDRELAALRRQHERLQRELNRQQTLVRLAQRSIGVPPTPATKPVAGKKRQRRPTARALSAAAHLQQLSKATAEAAPAEERNS